MSALAAGSVTENVRRHVAQKAASYASDAATFRDAAQNGSPWIGTDEATYWARVYQAVAQELRHVHRDIPLR